MIVINITPNTEKTKNFDPAVFYETTEGIFSKCKATGLVRRDDMNHENLMSHLQKMQAEGFKVEAAYI